jgi:hypothetical protein
MDHGRKNKNGYGQWAMVYGVKEIGEIKNEIGEIKIKSV